MNIKGKLFLAALAPGLFAIPQANAGIPIERACAQVFEEGKDESEVVNVRVGKDGRGFVIGKHEGHGFVIKKRNSNVERSEGKIKVTGYFWHLIDGENDRIHYTIVVEKGRPYEVTVENIDLGGLFKDKEKDKSIVPLGIKWTGKIGGGLVGAIITKGPEGVTIGSAAATAFEKAVLNVANKIQRELIGNWTPGIPVILDGMADYFANQL